MKKQKQAIIYCRVAANDQKDLKIKEQKKLCRAYAEKYNYRVVRVFLDQGSGIAADRVVLKDLLIYCGQNRETALTLITNDPSRLSRSTTRLWDIFACLKRNKIDILYVSPPNQRLIDIQELIINDQMKYGTN